MVTVNLIPFKKKKILIANCLNSAVKSYRLLEWSKIKPRLLSPSEKHTLQKAFTWTESEITEKDTPYQ